MLRLFLPCRIVIYISSTTHYCVKKAIKVVGISECHVRMVDTVEGEMCASIGAGDSSRCGGIKLSDLYRWDIVGIIIYSYSRF